MIGGEAKDSAKLFDRLALKGERRAQTFLRQRKRERKRDEERWRSPAFLWPFFKKG